MALRVSGPVAPEIVRQTNMEATINSRTSHSRVAVSMGEHIHRAELFFQSHKKAHNALELEHHQLAETKKKILDCISALEDQRVVAKRNADALPPYDERSHAAMNQELVELHAGMETLKEYSELLDSASKATVAQLVQVSEQLGFLQSMLLRDKHITSSESAPKAAELKHLPVTSKVHEFLPSIYERGSSASGESSAVLRTPSPRQDRSPRNASTPNGSLNGLNWPGVVTATYTICGELGKSNASLRHRVEASAQQILVRCRSLRSQVVKQQTQSIDSKVMHRQRIITELDGLEGKIFDLKQQWKGTSEVVQRMKEPLNTSSARHQVRETVEDNVGQALVEEKARLAKSRHELKKLCKSLAAQVDILEAQKKAKLEELQHLDAELRQDRAHCTLENPVGILARPHPIRIAAIRTYPHLLQSREIFGRSASVSPSVSPRNDRSSSVQSSSGKTPGEANAAISTLRLSTPRNAPFDAADASRVPVQQATKIPAAPPRK